MRIGVSFPTTEIGNDPNDIRHFAQEVEAMGYNYLTCIDHVIQAREALSPDWRAYYVRKNPFHETLILFGFLAAATQRLELTSAILILPQRPTILVAKQLAEIDVLSGGRLRVGVGIGWNEMEFHALRQNFKNRAHRIEEQVVLLRSLWTEEIVIFHGSWDRVEDAGINPLPVQSDPSLSGLEPLFHPPFSGQVVSVMDCCSTHELSPVHRQRKTLISF